MRDLNKEMTVVMVSHEYHFVSSLVDYVICIHGGCHIHQPSEISAEQFRKIITEKYHVVVHDHEGGGKS